MLLSGDQLAVLLIGAFTPLAGYVVNYIAPWTGEKVKALAQVALAALGASVYQIIDQPGGFEWSLETRQFIATAVVGALAAHGFLWRPSEVSTALGGGRNA